MFSIVQVDLNQKVDLTDFTRFATLPRDNMDKILYGVIGAGKWYRGFRCTDLGNGQLNVDPGEIYIDGVGYVSTQAQKVNLLEVGPVTLKQKFAIIVSGATVPDDVEPTTILTNSLNRATTGTQKARLSLRQASVDKVGGNVSADPKPPGAGDIPPNAVIVAYVTMEPTKISDNGVLMNALALLPSGAEARKRLDATDIWRSQVGATIDSLGSTITSIQGQLRNAPTAAFVQTIAKELANVKYVLKLPDDYAAFGADHYLDNTLSDTTNVDYLATVQEGIRFPPANQASFQLGLQNIYNGDVVTVSQMLYPRFNNKLSLSNTLHSDTVICTQYQYQTVQYTQLSMNRVRYRVGPWFTQCSNFFWYQKGGGTYDALTGIFTLFNGETYEVYPDDQYLISDFTSNTIHVGTPIRLRQVWYDGLSSEAYTSAFPTTNTVSGAIHGNTFVSPQDGWLPQLNLYFSDKAPSGDVTVLLMQVPSNGQPNYTKVIATATLKVQDIQISTATNVVPSPVYFAPLVAFTKGSRYAFAVVTAGAHSMWRSDGNKVGNGSYFVSTDQAWAQQDLTKDLCFDLIFAEFTTPQLAVRLNDVTLDGGIASFDVTSVQYTPPGTKISLQVLVNSKWIDIDSFAGMEVSALNGLPPTLPLQAVFTGTTDMMPGLGVASNSRIIVSRPRSDYRHISNAKTLPPGVTTTTVKLECRLEWWRGDTHHKHFSRLRYGAGFGTFLTPTSVTDVPAPDDPDNAILRTVMFTFPSAQATWKIEQYGTTDNVLACYHVAEGDWIAL